MRPASWRFSGVPFWAPGVFGILLGPSEAFSLGTRGGKGFRVLLLFCFFPLLFCGHTFSRMTGGGLTNPAVVSPAPRPSEGQGGALFWAGAYWPPRRPLFRDFDGIFCNQWGQGPTDALRPGPFCQGWGPFWCPHTGPFHTHLLFFPAPGFFFAFEARCAMLESWKLLL